MPDEHPIGVALENRLMSNGIYVTSVTWADEESQTDRDGEHDTIRPPDGAGLTVEYETVTETSTVTAQEVSAVVRTLLSIAEEREWMPGRLDAISMTTDGDRRGRWHVERTWFEELGTERSEREFSKQVLNTRRTDSHQQ